MRRLSQQGFPETRYIVNVINDQAVTEGKGSKREKGGVMDSPWEWLTLGRVDHVGSQPQERLTLWMVYCRKG